MWRRISIDTIYNLHVWVRVSCLPGVEAAHLVLAADLLQHDAAEDVGDLGRTHTKEENRLQGG